MSDLTDRMNLIVAQLALALPARVVTRDFLDFSQRVATDLEKGVYTLISKTENGYKNYSGREGMDGTQSLLLVGQFAMPETTAPSAIEDAELTMADEIKLFLRARPPLLAQLYMTGFRQSQQMDAPYGWVAIDLQFIQ